VSAHERLAVIQARDEELGGLCAPDCAGEECQAERDRRELLDMVRELQARHAAIDAQVRDLAKRLLDEDITDSLDVLQALADGEIRLAAVVAATEGS
jgi:hypothetical protein